MKVLKLNALSEIQLLTGFIPSIILPLIAFVAAAIQKRYREDYLTCLSLNDIELEDDNILVTLRLMQSIFYAYSLIYFFLLVKMSDERIS